VKRLLFAGVLSLAVSVAHADYATTAADADQAGFWVGDNYYWPDGNTYYNRRTRAYTWLDRSVPTMADAPSWLRYPMRPRWQVIGRSRHR
jgi:hypothetical protein